MIYIYIDISTFFYHPSSVRAASIKGVMSSASAALTLAPAAISARAPWVTRERRRVKG